jgi:hypothetical protein
MRWSIVTPAAAVMAAAGAAPVYDHVALTGVTAADEPALAVMGRRELKGCDYATEPAKNPAQTDFENFVAPGGGDETCLSEIALFSQEHAALILKNPPFTSGSDAIPVGDPGARLDIPLNVVAISDNQTAAQTRANDAVNDAITNYNQNRVGLRFVLPLGVRGFATADPTVAGVGTGCESIDGVRASSVYDPSMLNVYFVPAVDMPEGRWGYDCFEYGAPDIIYISLNYAIPPVLSHEIGHAFSLRGVHGHVNDKPGFHDPTNLMWKQSEPDDGRAQNMFTLGQAYRMNVDLSSWINLKVGKGTVGVARRPGEVKGCQDVLSENWPCLRLREAWP